MPGSSANDIMEMLIRYIDDELSPDERTSTEKILRENADVDERYQYLLAAKQAIRSQKLKQRVQAAHNEYLHTEVPVKMIQQKIVKSSSFFRALMRVAAVFIALIAGFGIFEYGTTTDQSVYRENFINYELPVNRGAGNMSNIDSLYSSANYTEVINAFEGNQQRNQKEYFITAQSFLHLDKADKAISAFEEVKILNDRSDEKYFADETDYYLALAYIKSGRIDEAETLLNKITSDKHNLFYNKAKDISSFKLKILKLKK